MSFALMVFSGSWGNGATGSSQAAGQSGATSGASISPGSTTATPPAPSQPGTNQAGTSLESQLLTDVQSLMSTFMGTTGTEAGSTANTDASASTATSADPGTGKASGLGNTVQQDLQAMTSDLSAIALASGSTQSGGVNRPPPPNWPNVNTSTNPSTGVGETGGRRPTYTDDLRQQFALSAYSASTLSGPDASATSSMASITA
jgi:hypothetical protein